MSVIDRIKNIRRTKDPKKVVAKAADLLEREPERWNQGEWIINPKGEIYDENSYWGESCEIGGVCKVCLEGALLIFAKDRDTYQAAYGLVIDELNKNGADAYEHLFSFNDSNSTTVDDVVEVLRAATQR